MTTPDLTLTGRYFLAVDRYGDETLWQVTAGEPLAMATKVQLDILHPSLWPVVVKHFTGSVVS